MIVEWAGFAVSLDIDMAPRAKSYKLRANLVDFGGTAQKEQLVYCGGNE